jgi:hypothetical protein
MTRKWWGYRHVNGTVAVKPYLGLMDIDDALSSPYVKQVVRPFEIEEANWAIGYDLARARIIEETNG